MKRELSITTWHGESRSLFYVMASNPQNESDWEVKKTFTVREQAIAYILKKRGAFGLCKSCTHFDKGDVGALRHCTLRPWPSAHVWASDTCVNYQAELV